MKLFVVWLFFCAYSHWCTETEIVNMHMIDHYEEHYYLKGGCFEGDVL